MADKSLEQYNDPKEHNYIGLTFNVAGKEDKKYDCHANTYRETALNIVEQEFSDNVVDQYNQMIATRKNEMESGKNKSFSESEVVQKAYVYYDPEMLRCYEAYKKGERNRGQLGFSYVADDINKKASSLYIDLAIASAINKYEKEENGAANAEVRSQGIARTRADYSKSFSSQRTGYIPPEKTIEYFDNLYTQNHIGSVKVDLKCKDDLAQHIQNEGVHKGSRVVCDVEETRHDSSVVIAVKKEQQEGCDFYEIQDGNYLVPLKADNPKHKSAIEKAQQAVDNKELTVWREKPNSTQLNVDPKSVKVEYDYVLKETREYMYTGVNSKNEPTFSRLTGQGGDLNVPLSELPITKTHAVVDHTKLCLAKAGQQFDNSPTLKPDDIKDFVPNLALSYTLPKHMAEGYDDPKEIQSKAKMVFENIYNEHNPEIKGMLLAQNMKDDHERAMDLADNRSKAVQTAEKEEQNVNEEPVLAMKKDNNKTEGLLSVVQNRNGGRS